MCVLPGGVAKQVDDNKQVQFFQGLAPAILAAHAEQGVAGNHHQGPHRVVVIQDHVRQQVAGQGATDMP